MGMAIEHPWRALGVILFAAMVIASCEDELAHAEGPVFVGACSKSTCEPIDKGKHSKKIATSSITGISDSTECPGVCSEVSAPKSVYHVWGNWLDIVCQVWGGVTCQWNFKDIPEATINKISE